MKNSKSYLSMALVLGIAVSMPLQAQQKDVPAPKSPAKIKEVANQGGGKKGTMMGKEGDDKGGGKEGGKEGGKDGGKKSAVMSRDANRAAGQNALGKNARISQGGDDKGGGKDKGEGGGKDAGKKGMVGKTSQATRSNTATAARNQTNGAQKMQGVQR